MATKEKKKLGGLDEGWPLILADIVLMYMYHQILGTYI